MNGIARKYNLIIDSTISCGLGTYSGHTQCSLLNTFTITACTIPLTVCTYPTLTLNQLQNLSVINYNKRVCSFIIKSDIENGTTKKLLYSGATYNEPLCSNYLCLLNPNFFAYKFLTGLRIVDTGTANGVVQYLVSGGSYNSGWQSNATFLNLNQNAIYTVAIRDYIASVNIVVCQKTTIVSMPALLQSTTETLAPKMILLSQITTGNIGSIYYKTGCIKVSPNVLSPGQKVQINYTANANASGDTSGCVQLTCQENGTSGFINKDCLTSTNISPRNNSLILCYGDIVCYNVTAIVGTYGSNASSNICLTSVNGLTTITPTIDATSCSASISAGVPQFNVTVSMNRTGSSVPGVNSCSACGTIDFTPAIPNGQCIMVGLSAITSTIGSGSLIYFYCKKSGDIAYINTSMINATNPQPQLPVLTARYGDSLCYNIVTLALYPGTSSSACMCLNNLTASIGVNPIKSTVNNYDSLSIATPAMPVNLAICEITNNGMTSTGYINVNPPLILCGQCVTVDYEVNQTVCGTGTAKVNVYRIPNGQSLTSYCNFVTYCPPQLCGHYTGNFVICYGDVVCYSSEISTDTTGSCSSFCINSVIGTADLIPTIDLAKRKSIVIN
jgi:hypothetical protein